MVFNEPRGTGRRGRPRGMFGIKEKLRETEVVGYELERRRILCCAKVHGGKGRDVYWAGRIKGGLQSDITRSGDTDAGVSALGAVGMRPSLIPVRGLLNPVRNGGFSSWVLVDQLDQIVL